jgi:2-phospho-L-lactate guanylyltransferase
MPKELAIVVPVKPLAEGKTRLHGRLSQEAILKLNSQLLLGTLQVVADLCDLADVYVVSRSAEVLQQANHFGFNTCLEPASLDLNLAIGLGRNEAAKAGATELMVVPVDLPWLSSMALRVVVDEFRRKYDVMVVTDRARNGTNLLLWRPISTAEFSYGNHSAVRHAAIAERLGLRVDIRQDRQLSFDIDTPADYEQWVSGPAPVF